MNFEGEQETKYPCGCRSVFMPNTGVMTFRCAKHTPSPRSRLGSEIHDARHMVRLVYSRLHKELKDMTVQEFLSEMDAMYKEAKLKEEAQHG